MKGRKQMITSNIDYERSSCSTRNTPHIEEVKEVKEIGIFTQTQETNNILTEIMHLLVRFEQEINERSARTDINDEVQAACYRDEVAMINAKAHVIRADLERIMDAFH